MSGAASASQRSSDAPPLQVRLPLPAQPLLVNASRTLSLLSVAPFAPCLYCAGAKLCACIERRFPVTTGGIWVVSRASHCSLNVDASRGGRGERANAL